CRGIVRVRREGTRAIVQEHADVVGAEAVGGRQIELSVAIEISDDDVVRCTEAPSDRRGKGDRAETDPTFQVIGVDGECREQPRWFDPFDAVARWQRARCDPTRVPPPRALWAHGEFLLP